MVQHAGCGMERLKRFCPDSGSGPEAVFEGSVRVVLQIVPLLRVCGLPEGFRYCVEVFAGPKMSSNVRPPSPGGGVEGAPRAPCERLDLRILLWVI